MLPPNDFILAEVRDVRDTRFAPWLDDHPTNVGPQEAAMRIVWIEFGIRVSVVCAVSARPPLDGPLHSTSTRSSEEVLQWPGRVIRAVGPQTVVSCGDAYKQTVISTAMSRVFRLF